MRTRFTNLRIPSGGDETAYRDLVVEDGTILEIASPSSAPDGTDEQSVDFGGRLVLPGVIDGHVHFDDPGFTHRENFETGTRAAAAGGVTCVVDMPCTSLPPVTSRANLVEKLAVIEPKARVDFVLWGGVSDNALKEADWRRNLEDIVFEGVGAIKVYMLSGMETFRDLGRSQLADVLREAARLGIPVGVHAEDRDVVRLLTSRLMEAGRTGPLAYAESRPPEVEISAVRTMCELSAETGARVHIVHLATGQALDVLTGFRKAGVPVSAETCPQYLAFTLDDLEAQGAILKTAPVVKGAADRERLWQGLGSRELAYVATDHAAGVWPEEKHTGSIWTDYGGVPLVELSLPYLFSEGVGTGRITLERLTEITALEPARFFGIDRRKGRIEAGLDADFTVLDENDTWTVRASDLHNLNRYSPFEGQAFTGRVRATYVRGEPVFERLEDGTKRFGSVGYGRRVRRESPVS